ncbi:MAG: hypothetical protein ACLFVU_09790, partial [Phycisphaerae bacterium]
MAKQEQFYDSKFSIEAIQHEPFENGFTWRAVLGAFFVAFVMLPGVIFMGLMIGQDLGTAADWVTIILFVELARRSFVVLRKQELFMLKYTVSHLSHIQGGLALGGGIFATLIWNRYLRNSEFFRNFGIAEDVPDWFAPYGDIAFESSFYDTVWWPVIGVIVGSMLLSKLTQLSLGWLAYKVTVDVEKLPFPLAPINAEGAIALAERSRDENKKGYRQYCFSIGVMVGAVFSLFYTSVPMLSQAFFEKPIQLLPIPFWDLTKTTEEILPAAAIGISLNLGLLFLGFVLPWRVVVGGFVTSLLSQVILPPILLQFNVLNKWEPGSDAIKTYLANNIDFYMSVGIGMSFAVFAVGILGMVKSLVRYSRKKKAGVVDADGADISQLWKRNKERGDPPVLAAVGVWVLASILFVVLADFLVNGNLQPGEKPFSVFWLILFAFVFTPINTYINARMSGIAGQYAGVPFMMESAIFMSGYSKVNIWFAPMPLKNFGNMADQLRVCELTRTKFTSILRAELLIFPLMMLASFIFWSYVNSLGPVPSDSYPYVQKMWPQFATMKALWASSMVEGDSMLLTSLKPLVIIGSMVSALGLFGVFSIFGISVQYIYGGIGAVTQYPHKWFLLVLGAVLGRYYFSKKFGQEKWQNYAPILAV